MDKYEMITKMAGEDNVDVAGRKTWSNRLDVLLAYIGYCVGFGNLWRFPYLCYRNGGGAFLIPYFLTLIFCAVPLYFLEISLGQFSKCSVMTVWKICPIFKGIGHCTIVACVIFCYYYAVLIAYALVYLFHSFALEVPWGNCENAWNTDSCRPFDHHENSSSYSINTTLDSSGINSDFISSVNTSTIYHVIKDQSPVEEFWKYQVLDISSGISEPGILNWKLCVGLVVCYIIVYGTLFKGVKSLEKVVYFTSTFPYVVLLILLIRAVTLEGAMEGILYFIIPRPHLLLTFKVWGDAATQIFYSLGQAWGILITYGSYNRFDQRSDRDSIITCIVCSFTSVLGGIVVFSVLGFLSIDKDVPIEQVAKSGPGMVFVVYAEALARMPIAPFWSVIFFFMLVIIGVNTQFSMIECIVCGVIDLFPQLCKNRRELTTFIFMMVFTIAAIPLCLQNGIYWLTFLDWYGCSFPPLVIALLEIILVSYIYGVNRFSDDIEMMLGYRPNLYWRICWMVVSPLLLIIILGFTITIQSPVKYGEYHYPQWVHYCGIALGIFPILTIPAVAIIETIRRMRNKEINFESIKENLFRPDKSWDQYAVVNQSTKDAYNFDSRQQSEL